MPEVAGEPLSQEAFDARYPALVCGLLGACCQRLGVVGSLAVCLDKQPPPKHEGYTFDPVQAGRCAATVDSIDNTGGIYFCDDPARGLRLPSCEKTYVYSAPSKGQTPPLGTCQQDADCEVPAGGTARCQASATGTRRCEVAIPVALGEECGPQTTSKPERVCGDDQFCEDKRCVLRPGEGEPCGSQFHNLCAPGLRCPGTLCQRPRPDGASCDPAEVCSPGSSCSPDQACEGFCDGATKLCVPPQPDGQTCRNEVLGHDCLSGHCVDVADPADSPSGSEYRCSPYPAYVLNACRIVSSP